MVFRKVVPKTKNNLFIYAPTPFSPSAFIRVVAGFIVEAKEYFRYGRQSPRRFNNVLVGNPNLLNFGGFKHRVAFLTYATSFIVPKNRLVKSHW